MENFSLPNTAQASQASQASQTAAAAPRTEVQHAEIQAQRIVSTKEAEQTPLDARDQDQARFDAVKKAAKRVVSTNPLSPSSARFTIYRDTNVSGVVYVTRFTNIFDGKVTLVRDEQLLADFAKEQGTILDGVV